jgi:hypothetical protein
MPAIFGALLLTLGLAFVATTQSSPAAPAEVRIVRVTAADIARLPAGQNYVIDLTQKEVAYDLDGRERPIDWARVRVRNAAGEKSLIDWLKAHAPKRAAKPFKHLGAGAKEGVAKIFDLKSDGKPETKYECGPDVQTGDTFCGCSSLFDCLDMFADGACEDSSAECTEDGCTCGF